MVSFVAKIVRARKLVSCDSAANEQKRNNILR
jgi:hypothetical protein